MPQHLNFDEDLFNDIMNRLNKFNRPAHESETSNLNIVTSTDPELPTKEISEEELFGPNLEEGKLPDFNATFKVIDEGRLKIIDLKEIEADILGQESICQEDINKISSLIDNFLGPKLSLEEFTKKPSKANFEKTCFSLRKRISAEELNFSNSLSNYFSEPEESVKSFVTFIQETFIPSTKEQVLYFQSQYREILDNIFDSKNVVLLLKNQSVNILNTPIEDIVLETDLKDLVQDFSKETKLDAATYLNKALTALKSLLNGKLNRFLLTTIEGKSEISHSHDVMIQDKVTIGDLVVLYQNMLMVNGLDFISEKVTKAYEDYNRVKQEIETSDQDFDTLNAKILELSPVIDSATQDLTNAFVLVKKIILLNVSIPYIMNFLKFCL